MLAKRALLLVPVQCRSYTSSRAIRPVPVLPDASLETFRTQAFSAATPALFPPGSFASVPAIAKWFEHAPVGNASDGSTNSNVLNRSYLSRYGSTLVPLEITNAEQFSRTEQSLSFFLECAHATASSYTRRPNRYFSAYVPGARAVKRTKKSNNFFSAADVAVTTAKPTARVYLAQAAITNLPQGLRDDVPTPEIVLAAGKGDVYDSSIWLGEAPTFTPLHRDPNPNLFVQLAGIKMVRLFRPDAGNAVFAKVQEKIGGSASAVMRGEEMMQGAEKKALEAEVWDDGSSEESAAGVVWETELRPGDGLFIPKGWWHSVKGVGSGMTGSANWWFR